MFQHADAKIQSGNMNTEFYPQHENNQIKWLILFVEHINCMGKQGFQYHGILGADTFDDVSCNISAGAK